MDVLLAAGAAVDVAAPGGQTPLLLACEAGALDCVRLLLSAGADRSLATTVRARRRSLIGCWVLVHSSDAADEFEA